MVAGERPIGLLVLLAVSWAVRVALALRGGQRFFPDETRYLRSGVLLDELLRGDLGAALKTVVTTADHTGFLFVGLVPALAQLAASALGGQLVGRTLPVAAAVLSLASVASIALTYVACRRAGGDQREGLLAALLMACATSMTYYARHLVPYDASLALALGALCVGLGESSSLGRSLLSGLLSGFAFLAYNGYWILSFSVGAIPVLGARGWRDRLTHAVVWGAGFASWLLILIVAGFAHGTSYVQGLVGFSRTVTQCEFSEGWWSPWAYLWAAEHGVFLVWGAGALAALWLWARKRGPERARCRLWLGLVLAIYFLMVLFSVGLRHFCVYARTSRQMVPFLVLTTAWAVRALEKEGRRRIAGPLAIGLTILAAWNLPQPFALRFPADVWRDVVREYERVGLEVTFHGPDFPEHVGRRWILLNARFLQPIRGVKPPPPGEVVFSTPYPFEYVPYQYEVLSSKERAILRSGDSSVRLIDTAKGESGRQEAAPEPGR